MKSRRLVLIASLVMWALIPVSAAAQCWDQIGNGWIGVYADPAGTNPCITAPPFTPVTAYVISTLAGATANGATGAEFRIEVSPAPSPYYVISWTANPILAVSLNSPIDDTPNDPTDPKGCNLAFQSCQPLNSGDRIQWGTISIISLSQTPPGLTLKIKQKSPPSSPNYECPLFVLCDAPLFSAIRMTWTQDDLSGTEPVAFVSHINQVGCVDDCPTSPYPPPLTAALGIYRDAGGSSAQLCAETNIPTTFYLLGKVPTFQPPGVTGAEFRIEVSNPSGYLFNYTPPTGAFASGNPFDLTPGNLSDAAGTTVLFPACRPDSAQAGSPVDFGTVGIVNLSGGTTQLRIRRRLPVVDPSMLCPRFLLCDAPFNSPACMGPVVAEDDVVFETTLNAASCQPPPFVTEHLQLDTHESGNDGAAGPVMTTQSLDHRQWFLITVQGTASLTNSSTWISPPNVVCGLPERLPLTSSSGVTNYWVGADPEVNFAAALARGSDCASMQSQGYPRHHTRFTMDLGSGFAHLEPLGGHPTDPSPGHRYRFLLKGTDHAARFRWEENPTSDNYGVLAITVEQVIPTDVDLAADQTPRSSRVLMLSNVPDPFNPTTEIRYVLPADMPVTLSVFDIRGRMIRQLFDGWQSGGYQSVDWDGRFDSGVRAPSGTYFARVQTAAGQATERLTLIK